MSLGAALTLPDVVYNLLNCSVTSHIRLRLTAALSTRYRLPQLRSWPELTTVRSHWSVGYYPSPYVSRAVRVTQRHCQVLVATVDFPTIHHVSPAYNSGVSHALCKFAANAHVLRVIVV